MAEKALLAKVLGISPKSMEAEAGKKPLDKEALLGKLATGKYGGPARYQLTIDSAKQGGVEKYYYWFQKYIPSRPPFGLDCRQEEKKGYVVKVRDMYNATETSSYWGNIEQRKGVQQDKVTQYLATIGKMLKDMFQIVRELRIIDERLEYYHGVDRGDKASDFALKGIWIDIVEGGSKNPASVYGLANQVGFVTLPDLFFATFARKADDVNDVMDKSGNLKAFNRKVREVLSRKLKQYLVWKEKTQKELEVRRNFTLKYLRQHYNIIRLYMNWIRPYLKNIQRLQMEGRPLSDTSLVSAFETSKIELEMLAVFTQYQKEVHTHYEETRDFKKWAPMVRFRFSHVSIPQMLFQSEYQRGPIHVGHTIIIIEGLVTTKKDLEKYINATQEEDIELLSSLFDVMDAMRDDLKKYLEEAGEKFNPFDVKKEEKKPETALEPFKAAFSGLKDLFSIFSFNSKVSGSDVPISRQEDDDEKGAAMGLAKAKAHQAYYVFKKSQKFVTE